MATKDSDNARKFDGATDEELREYVEGSGQLVAESDADWARRVINMEADLMARIRNRPQPDPVKDEGVSPDPLSSI